MYSLPPSHSPPSHLQPMDNRGFPAQETEAANLRDYWIIIRKYRWTIAAFVLPIALLTAISVRWPAPVYTATATVLMENRSPNIIGLSELFAAGGVSVDQYYETQLNLLRSRSLAAEVIRELDLNHHPNFHKYPEEFSTWAQQHLLRAIKSVVRWGKVLLGLETQGTPAVTNDTEQSEEAKKASGEKPPGPQGTTFELGVSPHLIDRYLNRLGTSVMGESQMVRVSFKSVDRLLARDIVNAHVSAFIRIHLLTRFQLTAEARLFLEEKLAELKTELQKSEASLNHFRKSHAIVGVEKGDSYLVERLRALNNNLTQARSKRIELETIHRTVQRRDNWLLSQVIDDSFVRQLRDQISKLEAERSRLATTFRPTHPGMEALQEQIDQVKVRMDQEVRRIVRTIESDFGAAKAREAALAQEMEEQRQAVLDLREKAIAAAVLERDVESNRTLYENILKRTKEANLNESVPITNVRVVDRADLPLTPDDTRAMRTLLLSVLVGLFGGVGLSFLRYYLDNTLKTPDDVTRYLRLPTVGMVPDVKRLDKQTQGLAKVKGLLLRLKPSRGLNGGGVGVATSSHPLSIVSESYQTVCTSILFSLPEQPPKTILITSSQPREGKTATALNVAKTLAQHGAPVLLIDADLRNGRCHRMLGLDGERGLTNVLTGERGVNELIKQTTIANLSLLPRGPTPPNPAVLLASEKVRQTLESLKADFSFIIIDSAPLLPINDSVLLSTKVDGVVLVIKDHEISRYIARRSCERLVHVKAKILGVILNGIDLQSPEYKYYKSSYASYHSGYSANQQ
jgi:succinoglycan biosynthesis transport protein ExoP